MEYLSTLGEVILMFLNSDYIFGSATQAQNVSAIITLNERGDLHGDKCSLEMLFLP